MLGKMQATYRTSSRQTCTHRVNKQCIYRHAVARRFSHVNVVASAAAASSASTAATPTQALEGALKQCLLQTAIDTGERGRGLFYTPAPGSEPLVADPVKDEEAMMSQQRAMPPALPPLLRVPLMWGLPLVCAPGQEGVELQEELLEEWQDLNKVQLPEALVKLLLATERPPAARMSAWFLWATRSPAAAGSPLAEFAAHVLPRDSASCLRLNPSEEARLPPDALPTLSSMRSQVSAAVEELRSLGAVDGFSLEDLWWAFDMVISRSFQVMVTDPNTGNPAPLAAYVPWACLVNHSPNPNAVFSADLSPDRREFVVVPRLRYTPIEPGFEVCISYGGGLDARSTLLKYGFVSTGNVNDRLELPPGMAEAAARLKQPAMISAAEAVSERRATAAAEASGGPVTSPSSSANLTAAEKERNLVYTALASVLEAAGEWQAVRDAEEAAGKAAPTTKGFSGGPVPALIKWAKAQAEAYAAPTGPAPPPPAPDAPQPCRPPAEAEAPAGEDLSAAINILRSERRRIALAIVDLVEEYRKQNTA